jgi:hypothetical protein
MSTEALTSLGSGLMTLWFSSSESYSTFFKRVDVQTLGARSKTQRELWSEVLYLSRDLQKTSGIFLRILRKAKFKARESVELTQLTTWQYSPLFEMMPCWFLLIIEVKVY